MRVCGWNIHVASHSLCVCICMFAQLCRHMWRPTSGGFFTSYFLRQGDPSNSPCPAFMWVNQTQVIGLAAGILPTSHLPSPCIFHFTKYWQTVLQSGYTNWDFHQIFKCFLVWWKKTGHLFLASKKERLYLVIYDLSNKFLYFISFIKLRKIISKNKLLENLLLSSFKDRNM